jgi:hypothetical protein
MKALSLGLSFVIAAAFSAFAQLPRQHSLSLSVETVGNGDLDQDSVGSRGQGIGVPTGDHLATVVRTTRTISNSDSESIQISVHNFSPMPDGAEVDWYFVAAPVNSDQQYIADKGSKTISLAGNGVITIPVTSAAINSQTTTHARNRIGRKGKMHQGVTGATDQSGDKLQGWMVRVVADGKVIDSAGSTDDLAQTVTDDLKIQNMTKH